MADRPGQLAAFRRERRDALYGADALAEATPVDAGGQPTLSWTFS